MENQEIIKKLTSLIQVDIDAVHSYRQAIEKIDSVSVKDQLIRFQGDHERHIENLSEEIQNLGGKAPEMTRDFKGFIYQGFTALKGILGIEGSLQAMRSNEKMTNRIYDEAMMWDLPTPLLDVIRQNREDERRHLKYIEQALERRTWEEGKEVA